MVAYRPKGVGLAMMVLISLLCGCGLAGSPTEEAAEGYLLRSEDEGVATLFVRYEPVDPGGSITGYMYSAYPAANPSGVYLETQRIMGSVDGDRVFIQLEQNPQSEYVGSVDGGTMELGSGTVSWEGETATLEDFGAAAEDLAEEAQGQPIQD